MLDIAAGELHPLAHLRLLCKMETQYQCARRSVLMNATRAWESIAAHNMQLRVNPCLHVTRMGRARCGGMAQLLNSLLPRLKRRLFRTRSGICTFQTHSNIMCNHPAIFVCTVIYPIVFYLARLFTHFVHRPTHWLTRVFIFYIHRLLARSFAH